MYIAKNIKSFRLEGTTHARLRLRSRALLACPGTVLLPGCQLRSKRWLLRPTRRKAHWSQCQAHYRDPQRASTPGTLRTFLQTLVSIAVALFVMPIAAAMITLMGSLSAPASAAEVQELPYVYTSSKILTAPRSDRSIPASIAYSHGSGVAPGRLHAVLQGSRSQPLLAAGISADTSSTSAQLTALGSNNALMSVASSSILTQESSPAAEVAGDGRDRVSDVLKVLDRRLDNAISGAQGSALRAIPSLAPSDVDEIKKSRELATEAVELVHQVWLDARKTGLDRDQWLKECMAEIDARPPKTRLQAHLLIKGFLARGPSDPYTRFIPPEEFKQLTKFDVSGAGANVVTAEEYQQKVVKALPRSKTAADGGVWVVGLIKGLAADQAGMRQGDEIVSVDGAPAETLTPFQVATLLRSPPSPTPTTPPIASANTPRVTSNPQSKPPQTTGGGDSTVSTSSSISWSTLSSYLTTTSPVNSDSGATAAVVEVVHEDGTPETLRVSRGKSAAVANPVASVSLRGDAGYVKLRTFNARAVPELRAAVADLERRGAQQLVLDLSDNRGGLVSEAIEIARLFLPGGSTVVSTRSVSTTKVTRVDKSSPVTDLPVVLLVNGGTASASEILAGALKDNCRAVVAGGPTYGKGLIQSVYELSDASGMAVTVGKYFTPAGVDIDRTGVAPNFPALPRKGDLNTALDSCKIPKQTKA